MTWSFERVLILAPHTDDGEFGCGGLISRLLREGTQAKYVAFSDCKASIPEGLPIDALKQEMFEATASLGLTDVELLDYQVRYFPRDRQKILEDLVKLARTFQPDLVLTPTTTDIHQDHSTVTTEAIRAFKRVTILGYELPWNNLTLPGQVIINLQESDIENKLEAIKKYKSQRFRNYSQPEYMRALAITRGQRVGVPFAEAFELIRLVQ